MTFLKDVFNHFFNGNTFQKGAALGYYAVFSIVPILIIMISILGLFFGKDVVSGELFLKLKSTLVEEAAAQIQNLIKNHHKNYSSVLTAIIGFATLLLSASGMFSQINNAFNGLWNIKAKPQNSILRYFTKHLSSFALLMLIFFVLTISTSFSTFLLHHSGSLTDSYRFSFLYEHGSSLLVVTFLFALMFEFLGDAKVHWKPALISGLFTAILFLLGKVGIAMLINKSHLSTTFGAASILALIMLWVYYTSQIIFLGASFLKVLSDKMKLPIVVNKNSVEIVQKEISLL